MSADEEKFEGEKLEKIVDKKVKERTERLEKKIEELQNKENKESTSPNKDTNISRRDFLKKAGFGALGLGALLSPVSALDVKSGDFNVLTSDGGTLTQAFEVDGSQSVIIPNGNLGIGVDNPSLPLEVGGSRGMKIPVGSNSDRSSSPMDGEVRINSETLKLEAYYSGTWRDIGNIFSPITATGGDDVYQYIDSNGVEYRVHAFTSTGTSQFVVDDSGDDSAVEALIVAGGGGGGGSAGNSAAGGGGGAGGLIQNSFSINETSYDIVVGSGGSGASSNTDEPGGDGGDSQAFGQTAVGGGGGGFRDSSQTGRNGGSGGGAGSHNNTAGGSGNTGQGYDGGSSEDSVSGDNPGAGGGGATAAGESVTATGAGGNGGDGKDVSNLFGIKYGENGVFAGGGGGGDGSSGGNGSGGAGGGGDADSDALPNTGGGGGGVITNSSGAAGKGGSGIVLIRYPLEKP